MTDTTQPPAETRDQLTEHEQMQDAQKGCVACALCGGHAVITDAGLGAGYYVQCSNSKSYKKSTGCLIDQRRLGGWAYNVMDWWNRLHTAARTRRAGDDAIPAGEAEIRAITAQMRRFMPNACGDWADKIDAALAAHEVRKVAFYDEPGHDIRPGESLADRDRRIYQRGRHDALNDEPEALI